MDLDINVVKSSHLKKVLYICSLFFIVVVSFIWRQKVLDVFPFEYDEGIHLVLARVLSAGYEPYREAFVSYPPLFAWSLKFPYLLFHSAHAIQLFMSLLSMLGVVAVAYLSTNYYGRISGIAAAIFVSFSPAYFIPSRAVMGEIPSIGLATLALALAEHYRRRGGWYWVLLSGMALSASSSMKVLPVFAPIWLGLVILSKYLSFGSKEFLVASVEKNWRSLFRDVMLSLLGFSSFLIWPVLFLYDKPSFYDQVLGMRFASRDVFSEMSFVTNGQLILDFLSDNPIIVILAVCGIAFVGLRRLKEFWLLVLWLILTWATMYILIPLRYKHLPILIPPLAVWAGFAVQYLMEWLAQKEWSTVNLKTIAVLATAVLVVTTLQMSIPGIIAENQGETVKIDRKEGRQNAIRRVNLLTSPRDCVVSDDPVLLYMTGRSTAPELAEVSITRITSGYLTTQQLTDSIDRHGCQVVVVATERFEELLPDLKTWLSDNYLLIYHEKWQDTYAIKRDTVQTPLTAINQQFLNGLNLLGVDLVQTTLQPGNEAYISFYWRLDIPLNKPFKVFIHVRDENGENVFQVDRPPFNGELPLDSWPLGTVVKETFWFDIPEILEAKEYTLYTGLYDPETLERIPPKQDTTGENAIMLGRMGIQ
ncbi:MAG: hypothetical protein P8186_19420 [Anaerolineae bacterium]